MPQPRDREYDAPWGPLLKAITGLVLALMVLPVFGCVRRTDAGPSLLLLLVSVPLALTIVCGLFTVRAGLWG